MSKLRLYDVFQKPPTILRKISLRRSGRWVFSSLSSLTPVKTTKTQLFCQINEPFGLCLYNQNNPRKTYFRGKPGDYVTVDNDGNLNLVTVKDFTIKFPKEKPPTSSEPMTSDNFLYPTNTTESTEISSRIDSNRSTPNKTSNGAALYARPTTTTPTY